MSSVEFVQNQFNLLIQTYEHFAWSTSFPNILCNILCNTDITSKGISKTLMANLIRPYSSFQLLMQDMANCYSTDTSNASKELQHWLFTADQTSFVVNYINNPFCVGVVNYFNAQLPPIETYYDDIGNTSYPGEYRTNMKSVFTDVFMTVYGELKEIVCVSGGGNACSDLTGTGLSVVNIKSYVAQIMVYIESQVYQYIASSDSTATGYMTKLFEDLTQTFPVSPANAGIPLKAIHYNLIFICFQPYFYFLYILSFLPSPNISSANPTERNGVIRGLAILATYKFIMYTLYGTYQLVIKNDPSSSTAVQLRQVIDMNVTTLFNEELMQFNSALQNVNLNTQNIADSLTGLQDVNTQITMARSNVNNIANNDAVIVKQLSRTNTFKWTWLAVLIMYLIGATAVIYIVYSKMFGDAVKKDAMALQILGGCSIVLLIIVIIFGIVGFSKS